ncbi:tetraspanin [Xylariaceae sp. FL1019]|nr:tetraspanin [Xylariaceae sp. FL1019]
MVNKVHGAFIGIDVLFAATGALILGFSIIVKSTCFNPPNNGNDAARDLLYQQFPFTAGIANSVITFIGFATTLPALATNNRGWLKLSGFLIVVSALFTLIIGLDLWIFTLRIKETFGTIWTAQNAHVQELMQTAFQCCGYFNSTSPAFQTDATCPSPASAALLRGCATPIATFSNTFVDNIFTALFGIVAVDALAVLAIACVLKDRKETERFRHIDEKSGARGGF